MFIYGYKINSDRLHFCRFRQVLSDLILKGHLSHKGLKKKHHTTNTYDMRLWVRATLLAYYILNGINASS